MDLKEIKKTQDTLGKIIKKPPLTEKLLSKPPFRFLHDVFTEVIRTTDFMKGLFTPEEMDSKNVTSKEAKIAFLKKVIECVTIVSGETLAVRPNKVIAGHEPEHTNMLLQVVGQCIKKQLSSEAAVEAVLSGKDAAKTSKSHSNVVQAAESKHAELAENKDGTSGKKSKHEKRSEHKRHGKESSKSEVVESGTESETVEHRKNDKKRHKAGKESSKQKNKTAEPTYDTETTEHHDKDKKRHESGRESTKKISETAETIIDTEATEHHDKDRKRHKSGRESTKQINDTAEPIIDTEKTEHHDKDKKRHKSGRESKKHKNESKELMKDSEAVDQEKDKKRHKLGKESSKHKDETKETDKDSAPAESEKDKKHREKKKKHDKKQSDQFQNVPVSNGPDEEVIASTNVRGPRPASAKGQRRKPKHKKSSITIEISDGENTQEIPARPPSARPGAPRIKHRADVADDQIDSGVQHTAPVIIDNDIDETHSDDDDDAQFVVKEEVPSQDAPVAIPLSDDDQETTDEEHGGLVKKILETKKELEQSAAGSHDIKHTDIERSTITAQQKKEREMVAREIEELRNSVQKLCQSVAPLAKIIDYIQEDMDAMQNELTFWKNENKQHAMRLKEEESITKRSIEPLNHELQELQASIASYRNQMGATKANIIRNDEKIRKMVMAVASRS